jgi:hypothetical protein
MKTSLMSCLRIAALSMAATSALAQEEAPVAVNTGGLPDHLRARIEEKAQHGVSELRRYLDSTKHIHGLRVDVVVKSGDSRALAKAAEEDVKVAQNGE